MEVIIEFFKDSLSGLLSLLIFLNENVLVLENIIFVVLVIITIPILTLRATFDGFKNLNKYFKDDFKAPDKLLQDWLTSDKFKSAREYLVRELIKDHKIEDPTTDESKELIKKDIDMLVKEGGIELAIGLAMLRRYIIYGCIVGVIGIALITYKLMHNGGSLF